MNTMKEVVHEFLNRDKFLVISHASPDGDTLGSATALIRALRKLGKKANFACGDTFHQKFQYLFEGIENEEFEPETFVTVDIADEKLMGELKGVYNIDIAIDHHNISIVDSKFKYVDSHSASNTMIMFDIINEMNVEICPLLANSLYTGLATDTGCFKFSNSSPKAHNIAAKLIEYGADYSTINRIMFDTKTLASLKIESEVISKMEFYYENKLLCATVSQEMLQKTGADSEDLVAIPSLIRSIEGVFVGITLKEKEDGMWKASVRAMAPVDASVICQKVGGGGHRGAGGCALTTNYEESKTMLVNACLEHLKDINL